MSTSMTLISRAIGLGLILFGVFASDPSIAGYVCILGGGILGLPEVVGGSAPSVAVPGASPGDCVCPSSRYVDSCPRHNLHDIAVRRYLGADPLDPTATLGFLLEADALSERSRSAISPSKPLDLWDQGVATDLASRGLLSSAAAFSRLKQ